MRFIPACETGERLKGQRVSLVPIKARGWGWRPGPLVVSLRRRHVPFAVVGSVAAATYDRQLKNPQDLDVVLASGDAAADAALHALDDLVLRYGDVCYSSVSVASLRDGVPLKVTTPTGTLDFIPGIGDAYRDAAVYGCRWVWLDRTWTPVASLRTLLWLKEYHPRAKDHYVGRSVLRKDALS
jgi:hypothetical protein